MTSNFVFKLTQHLFFLVIVLVGFFVVKSYFGSVFAQSISISNVQASSLGCGLWQYTVSWSGGSSDGSGFPRRTQAQGVFTPSTNVYFGTNIYEAYYYFIVYLFGMYP